MYDIFRLKRELRSSKTYGLALDIDETLSFTAKYWVDKLSKKFGNPDNLSAREVLQKYILIQRYPHFRNQKALNWMKRARSENKIQEKLPLIENANHIVNKINKIVPIVCYLTIRPGNVISGTQKWLDKHGFPKAPIITRPRSIRYTKGNQWKAKALSFLYPQVLGIVDDSLYLIDHLPKSYKGTIFLYDYHKNHKKRKNLIYCKNWEDVLIKVSERFVWG
ncbi:MAG: hypothetical protein HYT06_01230 [Candidatus Levybacteria bacterium]|nr:hypothetical protein [Candidatus Levybacteria bacterium]